MLDAMDADAGADTPVRVTEEDVLSRIWEFGVAGAVPYVRQLRLLPGGRLTRFGQDNEASWRVEDGALVFLTAADQRSTVFDQARRGADGRLTLEGEFRFAVSGMVQHRLAEVPALGEVCPAAEGVDATRLRPPTGRRNLLVVRAGDDSVHPQWLRNIEASERSWDICISSYGDAGTAAGDPDAELHVHQPRDRKYSAAWRLFHETSALWDYDFVALADDDMMTSWKDVNTLFATCRRFDLQIAQPCVSGGHIIQPVTARQHGTLLHYTSYVEGMLVTFSRDALKLCIPSFTFSYYGFGLDHCWPKMIGDPKHRMAVLDCCSMVHTRPFGAEYPSMNFAIREGKFVQQLYGYRTQYMVWGGIKG